MRRLLLLLNRVLLIVELVLHADLLDLFDQLLRLLVGIRLLAELEQGDVLVYQNRVEQCIQTLVLDLVLSQVDLLQSFVLLNTVGQ